MYNEVLCQKKLQLRNYYVPRDGARQSRLLQPLLPGVRFWISSDGAF